MRGGGGGDPESKALRKPPVVTCSTTSEGFFLRFPCIFNLHETRTERTALDGEGSGVGRVWGGWVDKVYVKVM